MTAAPATLDTRWPGALRPVGVLAVRRLRVTTKTASGVIGQLMTPILWILVVGPALADSLGSFNPDVDYFTFIAVGQVAFVVPFTAMFNGLNVIVDRDFGILRELLAAPVRRSLIPIANASRCWPSPSSRSRSS